MPFKGNTIDQHQSIEELEEDSNSFSFTSEDFEVLQKAKLSNKMCQQNLKALFDPEMI
jgi:hypothetical protein